MALIIPEVKHEYIFMEDSEQDKEIQFDQCRADSKEAAYSCFGTGELDSEYQPSPTKDPDYLMDYCSTDGHDYLKDYRLIWGYGIGIIEQDVICSLTTGEHLAEGTEACDEYASANTDGENIDWKRGTWLKFSGSRNVSPTRIGEVILPERVISLKDLCVALTSTDEVTVEGFNTNNVINMDNMFGKESSSNYRYYIISDFNFDSVKTLNYAFKRAHFVNFPYNINNKNLGGKSLFELATCDNEVTEVNMKLYSKMFYNSSIIVNNNFIFNDTDTDISYAFAYSTIDDFPIINFSNATNASYGLFSDIRVINNTIDKTLNLNTYINPETYSTSIYFLNSDDEITLHIISPINEVINYGMALIKLSNSTIIFDTIFIYNKFKLYNGFGNYAYNSDYCTIFSMYCQNITCVGTINGTLIGRLNMNNYKMFNDNSNIKIIQDNLNYSDLKKITSNNYVILPFFMLYRNRNNKYYDNIKINLNIFDFEDSQVIGNLFYYPNYRGDINTIEENIDIIVNINKPIIIIGRYFNSITVNNISEDNILIYNGNTVNIAEDLYDYILKVNVENDIEQYEHCYWINTNNDVLLHTTIAKIKKCNNLYYYGGTYSTFQNTNLSIYDCNKFIIDYNNENAEISGNIYLPTDFKITIEVINSYNVIRYGRELSFINIENKEGSVCFPNLENITDEYILSYRGRFIDYPLSILLNSLQVYFDNPYNCTYINDITETEINIHELAYSNYGINIDLSNFNVNVEYTDMLGTHNYLLGGSMIDTIPPNLKVNNITFLDYDQSSLGTATLFLQYIESNNLIINFDINRHCYLYLYNLPNLHKFTINNFYGSIYANNFNHQNNINVLLLGNNNIINNFLNLSAFDKLTQESINSIVNPSNYRSGATLTINTIPFQYITEEQKQALVDAGVTLVEYIPTETTE